MTLAKRQAAYKARMNEKGLEQLHVWVPSHLREDIRRLTKLLAENPDLELAAAPLRNVATGRVAKL